MKEVPPFFQTLTPGKRAEQERLVFDAATARVASIFWGLTFDGNCVTATAIPCRLDLDVERLIAAPQQCINDPVALSGNSNHSNSSSNSTSKKQ